MKTSSSDISFMRQALELASTVVGTTAPNPAVGAIVVKEGIVIGRGATSPAGGPHAEVHALAEAGDSAQGADLYVTLEPCNHYGKTPPCSKAIVAAGIKRVFIAVKDPNPLVDGGGIQYLQENHIEVITDMCAEEALQLNEHFFHFIKTKEPWVSIKLALTLDGRIADTRGASKWITGPQSREEVHRLRAKHTAIGVGSGTFNADNPQLTVRGVKGENPIRIVFTRDPKVGKGSFFRDNASKHRSILAVLSSDVQSVTQDDDGVEVWCLGTTDYAQGMKTFLKMAGEAHIDSLFIEGGSGIVRTLIELQKVNRLYLFYAPKIVGGGISGFSLQNPYDIGASLELKQTEVVRFGDDVMITGLPQWQVER